MKTMLLLIASFLATTVFAQQKHKIQLLDSITQRPIVQATFKYGNQQGVTDKLGYIYFQFNTKERMQVSHISYGSYEWNAEQIKKRIRTGKALLTKDINTLFPITVISVHTRRAPNDKVEMDYNERMQHDGAFILKQIPAFSTIQKGGRYGFDPVFRGYKYNQLNVVFDGTQSATAACPNRMDPPTSQMTPNIVQRIEVLKGPYALRYGTGFGATINFIPPPLTFSNQLHFNGRLSSGYEFNGNLFKTEGKWGFSSKNVNADIFAAWSQAQNYTTGNGEKVQSKFQRGSFGNNLAIKLSPTQNLQLTTIYNIARDAHFPALPMDLRDDDTWMLNLKHHINFHKGNLKSWETTLFGSFVNHLMDNRLKSLNPRILNAETKAETHNYGAKTETKWQFDNSLLFAGLDLKVEGAEGTRKRTFIAGSKKGKVLYDNAWQDSEITEAALFGEYRHNSNLFNYVFSGRITVNQAKASNTDSNFSQIYPKPKETDFNIGASIGITRILSAQTNIGLWIARVQRSGSLTERFINFFPVGQDPYELIGNPNIKPEINNQFDITFQWKHNKSTLDFDYFISFLQDYISSSIDKSLTPRMPTSPGVRKFINLKKALKTGFEISWSQQLSQNIQHQLGIAYTYAQNRQTRQPLPEIPPLDIRYTITGNFFDNKLHPQINLHWAAKQSRISKEYGETQTPGFFVADFKVDYQLSKTIRLNAGINNLFDKNYYEHLTRSVKGTKQPIHAIGRNFYTSINILF